MADFPAENYITNTSRITSEVQTAIEAWLAATKQLPGGLPPSEVTISDGSITVSRFAHSVDTEGNAPVDYLDSINYSQVHDGHELVLFAENASRTVVVRHLQGDPGQIRLIGGNDVELSGTDLAIRLVRNGTEWKQIGAVGAGSSSEHGIKVWDSAGNYTWDVPAGVNKIWVTCYGGGGGGGGGGEGGADDVASDGSDGEASSVSGTGFTTISSPAGLGGRGGSSVDYSPSSPATGITIPGAGGSPWGHEGSIGVAPTGGRGGVRSQPAYGWGYGGAGGAGTNDAALPGAGGGGGSHSATAAIKEETTVTPGQTITVIVGDGGAPGAGGNSGGWGANGIVIIEW